MSDTLQSSWNAFPKDVAKRYLKSFGHPSEESKHLLWDVLDGLRIPAMKLVDLGCGNANLAEYLRERRLDFSYTGVDFSDVLLEAAAQAFPAGCYIRDDVNLLTQVTQSHDVAVYSHVLEMLPSPESSLAAARKFAKKIVVRFFDPPADRPDWVELLEMNIGTEQGVPYLRRKMSLDYYRVILQKIGCTSVDIYRTGTRDQVHVLHFR